MIFNKEQLLKIIKENPLNAIKVLLLKEGVLVKVHLVVSLWKLSDFLEKMGASNEVDTILIAAKTVPTIGETKTFLDGKLLKYLGIIRHDLDKIPQEITLFAKSGKNLVTSKSPFFLFKEPQLPTCFEKPAVAFFLAESDTSQIAENIKLAEDAGFWISHSFIVSEQSVRNGINRILEFLQQIQDVNYTILFFKTTASFLAKLEKSSQNVILSRDDLIISIFNARADGSSGKLKLANAVIAKEKTDFRNKISGLSRIKGGIGLKGPGETKEEERKRILKNKEKSVRKGLKNECERLEFQRKFRKKSNCKTVAIVGYTNAGKSTLFNALLNEKVTKESKKFFSSIDPKIRKLNLFGHTIFLLDTVGFISEMSQNITDAFNSTFSEIANSALILHVIDSTTNGWEERKKFIETILLKNGSKKENIISLFSKKDKIKIKHPVLNGFFYDSHNLEDIGKIKYFIDQKLFHFNS